MWLPDPAGPEADAVPDPGLPAQLHVCGRVMGLLPHQAGGRPRADGAPCHTLPCPHQHLQQCQVGQKLYISSAQAYIKLPALLFIKAVI